MVELPQGTDKGLHGEFEQDKNIKVVSDIYDRMKKK